MTTKKQFKKSNGDWYKLFDFMNKNHFTCLDFMICICVHLLHTPENDFKVETKIEDVKFEIEIRRKDVN